ncbi:c-type cytochrome biogenesis protein CcmI [Thalassococcus sp. CAU 1522]|uniref:C-type cytochrome biogenesis protein CcmI n=1 Tax=Thalassococcus arenae TaxID=2851652 RepID=A0ABS6NBQ4_9RHOB|nr:c-type cytochrome biogenesis protein CcmI [Thalassococcus arenae]MBV2361413.1 c-type cytochrome biogenesis protein CcmI [Thalassococcus arenae]
MTVFWIATGALALIVAALLVLALLRGRRETGPAAAFDLQVYRDQLKEIDRDAARGIIQPAEAERLRTEVSRRLLAADSQAQAETAAASQPRGAALVLAAVIALVVIGGGFGLYWQIGAVGYPDLPLAQRIANAEDARTNRPSQAEAEAGLPVSAPNEAPEEYLELVERLRAAVSERPTDLQGLALLARSEATLGNYRAAYQTQQQIIAVRGDEATARDYADLADMMILAAGGYVSPEAQAALEQVLERDPRNGVARYYSGLMMAQTGRPDVAFRTWDRLLSESSDEAPWVPPILAQIQDLAYRAGVPDYQVPAIESASGPSREDMEAAADMDPEDRQAMIRGMVDGLAERLATEGGPPEEWARLINALAVLGERDQAQAILTEAQTVFAESPEALQMLAQAAAQAGLSQ